MTVIVAIVGVLILTSNLQGKPLRVRASDRLAVVNQPTGSVKLPLQPIRAPLAQFEDHFIFSRPLGPSSTWVMAYSFGSTYNGTYSIHHGLDFSGDFGTPVLSAGDGTVYYAGEDTKHLFGPSPDFYGNVVVLEHMQHDAVGRKLYTLYGHLSEVSVKTGQHVKEGDTVGLLGQSGIAEGPHLHFEVRAGNADDYNAVINPELWLSAPANKGVLAGRIVDQNKNVVERIEIQLSSEALSRTGYTYADSTVTGDPILNENFTLAELPVGEYTLTVQHGSGIEVYNKTVQVKAGQVAWLEISIDTSFLPPAPIAEVGSG